MISNVAVCWYSYVCTSFLNMSNKKLAMNYNNYSSLPAAVTHYESLLALPWRRFTKASLRQLLGNWINLHRANPDNFGETCQFLKLQSREKEFAPCGSKSVFSTETSVWDLNTKVATSCSKRSPFVRWYWVCHVYPFPSIGIP